MNRTIRVYLIVAATLTLNACANYISGGPLVRPGEPVGAVEVINGSRYTLTAILISACSSSTYGLNRLPDGVTVPPGRSYRFTVSAGCWDVDAGLSRREARHRLTVRARATTRLRVTG
jgi:hypothetical protein